ncbi:MAG: hypothetical protein IPJ38_09915 [Dechloromonas sp.]|uniref:Uncharacterized protein n=1 Tax=Candidatus Dechloromonas phosphorivorans TaxID=2899244 RepID=A0A935K2T4_9RHOO|nr:hypothetical protein [Candidatus Dechloromonas phosphorivorans]
MSETLFCYCCRVHHPSEQMHRFRTRHGFRWRCRRSIEAAKCPTVDRDAFGRTQSEINRKAAEILAERIFVPLGERRLQR